MLNPRYDKLIARSTATPASPMGHSPLSDQHGDAKGGLPLYAFGARRFILIGLSVT